MNGAPLHPNLIPFLHLESLCNQKCLYRHQHHIPPHIPTYPILYLGAYHGISESRNAFCLSYELNFQVDGFSIPHTVLRHFDLTSTPFTETFNRDVAERRRTYPDSAIFLDQLLSLASIDGTFFQTSTCKRELLWR